MLKSRIHVLQVVTRLVVRGVPRHVIELAAGLDPERFRVEVIAGRREPGEGDLWDEARLRGVRTTYLPALQRAVRPWADLQALANLCRIIRRGQYDIVHTHISKAGVLGRIAAKLMGVGGVIHTYHGLVGEVAAVGGKGAAFRLAERAMARVTDRLVAVSEDTARQCLSRGIGVRRQYAVIHNGIDVDWFAHWRGPRPSVMGDGQRPALCALGSLTTEKRIDLLLQALSRLAALGCQPALYVVGDGPLRADLEHLTRQLRLTEQVHFVGLVDDVRPFLFHVDGLVAPSAREGFPTVLLEAMAMGCPIVASRVGGTPEIVDDGVTGLLVAAGRVEPLCEAIRTLINHPDLSLRLGQAARKKARDHFGVGDMLRHTAQLYEDVLKAHQSP